MAVPFVVSRPISRSVPRSVSDRLFGGSPLSEAALFLATNGPYGMVMDFTDASIAIDDVTDVLNYTSIGQVSGGSLIGPGAKLTNTAPSAKLTEQADGNLGFQAHNLLRQSETFTSASWTKSGATAADASTLQANATTALHYATQTIAGISGSPYVASIEMKMGTHRYASLQMSDGASGVGCLVDLQDGTILAALSIGSTMSIIGTPTMASVGDGWYRLKIGFVHGTASSNISVSPFIRVDGVSTAWGSSWTATGSETIQVRKAHLRRAPSASDYIATTTAAVYDLPYVYSSGVRTGIMVEPAATNLVLQSADLSSGSWSRTNLSATSASDFWYELNDGVASGVHTIAQSVSFTSGTTYVFSMVAEDVDRQFLQCYPGTGAFSGAGYANFDLLSGTVSSSGGTIVSASIEALNTGGFRCILVMTATATAAANINWQLIDSGVAGRGPVYTGTSKKIRARLPQVETGTVATSPIITYGSTVLRAADNISIATSLFPYSASVGTAYGSIQVRDFTALTSPIASIDSNGRWLYISSAGEVTTYDGVNINVKSGPISKLTQVKCAAAMGSGGASVTYGGLSVSSGSFDNSMGTGPLYIGSGNYSSAYLNGLVSQILWIPRRMSDAELQAVTA